MKTAQDIARTKPAAGWSQKFTKDFLRIDIFSHNNKHCEGGEVATVVGTGARIGLSQVLE